MTSNTKPSGYGHLLLTHFPQAKEIRIKVAGQSDDGMKLFTIPVSTVGSSGIKWEGAGKPTVTFHHLAVEEVARAHVAYAYEPGVGNLRKYRLGPCSITMDK